MAVSGRLVLAVSAEEERMMADKAGRQFQGPTKVHGGDLYSYALQASELLGAVAHVRTAPEVTEDSLKQVHCYRFLLSRKRYSDLLPLFSAIRSGLSVFKRLRNSAWVESPTRDNAMSASKSM